MEDIPPIHFTDTNTSRVEKSAETGKTNGQWVLYGLVGLLLLILVVFAVLFTLSYFFPIRVHVKIN